MTTATDVPHLADTRITFDEAIDLVAEAGLRFEGAETDDGRERFAGFLERLAAAWRSPCKPVRPGSFAATLVELESAGVLGVDQGACGRGASA